MVKNKKQSNREVTLKTINENLKIFLKEIHLELNTIKDKTTGIEATLVSQEKNSELIEHMVSKISGEVFTLGQKIDEDKIDYFTKLNEIINNVSVIRKDLEKTDNIAQSNTGFAKEIDYLSQRVDSIVKDNNLKENKTVIAE